jgi:putative nucleotidyltransferase with HDIG domain
MNIPDIETCTTLMEEYRMLVNIRCHSLMVARIADLLVTTLQKSGLQQPLPNRQLCISGALLHDIAKTPCLNGNCDHALAGAEICLQHGFPEIAAIVEEHVILKDHNPGRYAQGIFSAREIVYYADKRVRHDEIVSLDERLEYIIERYGNDDVQRHALIRANFDQCVQLEGFLFHFFEFPPEELAARIERGRDHSK